MQHLQLAVAIVYLHLPCLGWSVGFVYFAQAPDTNDNPFAQAIPESGAYTPNEQAPNREETSCVKYVADHVDHIAFQTKNFSSVVTQRCLHVCLLVDAVVSHILRLQSEFAS